MADANVMREVRVAKLVLNISVGESGDRLQKAAKVRIIAQVRGAFQRLPSTLLGQGYLVNGQDGNPRQTAVRKT